MLGAYIKPFSENSRLSWGTELTAAPGVMLDRNIFNSMIMGGIEYSSRDLVHSVYLEGVGKFWYNTKTGPGTGGTGGGYSAFSKPAENHLGIRELFYRYNGKFILKGGIQSVKSPDFYLIDERMLGISAQKTFGPFRGDIQTGTVFSGIARMRDVCGVRHLYNLTRGGRISFVGDNPGDANFSLGVLSWSPGKEETKEISLEPRTEEFIPLEGKDEFGAATNESDVFSDVKKKKIGEVEKAGILFYEEFGSRFHDYKYHAAAFIQIKLPLKTDLKGEILYQYARNTKAWILMSSIGKTFQGKNGGTTQWNGKWFHLIKQDEKVLYFPSFSNLFLGEMVRLDVMHSPLFVLSADHVFPSHKKIHLNIEYLQQLKGDRIHELDCIAGMKLNRHSKLTAVTGYVSSDVLNLENFLCRLELRIAF